MGCVHGRQGQAWQPEHPGETHKRRLPGEKPSSRQKQQVGRKEDPHLGSRTDANDCSVTNNNSRKPALNFESVPPPRVEVQPCTPRSEVVVQPYNFTSSPSTPRLEALRLEGMVARRSLHGSTTSLQSCLKDPLRDEDSGSLHSTGSRVSFSEDVRVRPISSRGKGRPVGSSSPRTTPRSALEPSKLESSKLEPSKSTHSSRTHSHESPQASPRSLPRGGGYVEPRWVKELGGASSTETGML